MSAPVLAPGHELLDDPLADPAEVRLSLRHIARANRWFGGWWAVRRGLERVLGGRVGRPPESLPRPLTLLDVGCGAGDLALRAVGWGRRRGLTLVPIGIERHRAAAGLARDGGLATVLACAGRLPLRDGGVDVIMASQLMHHLAGDDIVAFCQAADRVARRGVIIADLRRSRMAQAGFWAGSRLFGFDAATKADGITSVRRGFSAGELRQLLARAGLAARVERTPGFRLVATWAPGTVRA
jgi:SAM-dependent methyltransferase